MTADLARLWSDLAGQAILLDPAAIRATILSTQDDGLRAASYDGAGGRSADVSSHPERQALKERRDRTEHDLRLLNECVASYVTAVAEIAVRSRSGRPCEDWAEAVQDHNLLDQMDAVGILERLPGEKPSRWVHKAGDALHDICQLARRHGPARQPTDDEKHWDNRTYNDNDVCAWHLDVSPKGRYRRPRVGGTNLCAACLPLAEMGHKRPPQWLLEAEVERDAKPRAWTAALSRYADELGLQRGA